MDARGTCTCDAGGWSTKVSNRARTAIESGSDPERSSVDDDAGRVPGVVSPVQAVPLELYRQAAALDPSRPEPYIMGLELAARTKNYQAVVWSAPEVLSYSWSKGREQLNRLAEQAAAAEAEAAFIESGDFAKCGGTCRRRCGKPGVWILSFVWNGTARATWICKQSIPPA